MTVVDTACQPSGTELVTDEGARVVTVGRSNGYETLTAASQAGRQRDGLLLFGVSLGFKMGAVLDSP